MLVYQGTPPVSRYFLEHYGRKGMHWYQHIYGDVDTRGKYRQVRRETRRDIRETNRLARATRRAERTKDPEKKEARLEKANARFERRITDPERREHLRQYTDPDAIEKYGDLRSDVYKLREQARVSLTYARESRSLANDLGKRSNRSNPARAGALRKRLEDLTYSVSSQMDALDAYDNEDVRRERRTAGRVAVRNALTLGLGERLADFTGWGYTTSDAARMDLRFRKARTTGSLNP